MQVDEAIRQRRSVKHFDPGHRVSDAEYAELLELARCVPTAFNIQNWRIVRIADAALRRQIRAMAWDQPQVTDAALLLVLCFDRRAWDRDPARYWRDAPPDIARRLVPEIRQFYRGREQFQRDEGHRSCGILAQTLMLAATARGWASCAMDGFDYEAVGRLIRLPPDHEISLMVAIGRARLPAHQRPGLLDASELAFTDRFPA